MSATRHDRPCALSNSKEAQLSTCLPRRERSPPLTLHCAYIRITAHTREAEVNDFIPNRSRQRMPTSTWTATLRKPLN